MSDESPPTMDGWRETANGWTHRPGPGAVCSIQLMKRGGVAWVLNISGKCETIAEAQELLERLVGKLGLEHGELQK